MHFSPTYLEWSIMLSWRTMLEWCDRIWISVKGLCSWSPSTSCTRLWKHQCHTNHANKRIRCLPSSAWPLDTLNHWVMHPKAQSFISFALCNEHQFLRSIFRKMTQKWSWWVHDFVNTINNSIRTNYFSYISILLKNIFMMHYNLITNYINMCMQIKNVL